MRDIHYRSNAKVTPGLWVIVDRDIVDDAVTLAHLTQEHVINVVVQITERHFFRQHRTDVVGIVLQQSHQTCKMPDRRQHHIKYLTITSSTAFQ